ncbi:MAG: leucine-rich repeat protein, partial [Legionella sp.]|nr:leucine-rich repeat protein [Legionella sp.]
MQLSKDRSQIISVSNDDIKEGYFIIPDTVTYIEYEAFRGCTELRTLCLPRKDITISCHAFIGCTNLTTIQLPEGATIGQDKF